MESAFPGQKTTSRPPPPLTATARQGSRGAEERLCRTARQAEARLAQRVLGQPEAVAGVARALRRAAAGLSSPRGPLARLLLVGPTGTGKTELARALADQLGGPQRLHRIDCSEFGGGHETSKLLGAPPGYVGHEHAGVLGRRKLGAEDSVVLFDEIEKAHPRMHELLLQVLDEGRLTDGRGEVLDFRRSFLILTSNAGTRELEQSRKRLGFSPEGPSDESARATVHRALGTAFPPEFLGRLDEILLFRPLSSGDLREVAVQNLLDLALRVRGRSRRVCFTGAVARWVAARAEASTSGARGVLHLIRREIEAPLAEALLETREEGWIEVSIRNGRPRLTALA